MASIKDFIFREVQSEDESSKPAIVLRLSSVGMMIYYLLLTISVLWNRDYHVLGFTAPCFLGYGAVFAMTYYGYVKAAAYSLNLLTIIWIVLYLDYFGWDLGVQQFLFVLILIDFFLPYWKLGFKLAYVGLLCMFRITMFFFCKSHLPKILMLADNIFYYQVVNTVSIFAMISICGCLISSNFLDLEKKLIETNKMLRHQAGTDPLTQLMNRLRMMEYASEQIKREIRNKGISVAIGDIDHFKWFNDTYGHECGDVVLKTLAALFQSVMVQHGAVARWGGEEFLFLFKESNGDEAYIILSELRDEVKKLEVEYGDLRLKVTMTFGLVEINRERPFDENIKEADDLLYYGKEHGRDQIVY